MFQVEINNTNTLLHLSYIVLDNSTAPSGPKLEVRGLNPRTINGVGDLRTSPPRIAHRCMIQLPTLAGENPGRTRQSSATPHCTYHRPHLVVRLAWTVMTRERPCSKYTSRRVGRRRTLHRLWAARWWCLMLGGEVRVTLAHGAAVFTHVLAKMTSSRLWSTCAWGSPRGTHPTRHAAEDGPVPPKP